MTTPSKTPLAPASDLVSSAEAMQRGLDQQMSVLAGLIVDGAVALTRAVRKAWANYIEYRNKRRAFDELMSLDPRMLSDIGVSRHEIHAAVYGDAQDATSADAAKKAEGWTGSHPVHA